MKKRSILLTLAVILVLAAVVGGTLASFNSGTTQGQADITLEDVQVALAASVGDEVEENYLIKNAVPGQREEIKDCIVSNSLENGYEIYTKVVIDKQWENNDALDAGLIRLYMNDTELSEASATPVDGWLVQYADAEQIILYYTGKLAPNEVTSKFLTQIKLDETMNNDYTDSTAKLTFTVYAVQAAVAEKAMVAEWGVYPTFDEAGNITAVAE